MTEKRIDGQADLKQYMAPLTGKIKIERLEMIDPKLQQSGDIAVLTFILDDFGAQVGDGPKTTMRWNSTEVFQRINGSWKIIHSHWSNVKPERNESSDARDADARAIRESETRWARAWAAKDIEKIVSHYADDASVELSGVPIMSGKDAIRARVDGQLARQQPDTLQPSSEPVPERSYPSDRIIAGTADWRRVHYGWWCVHRTSDYVPCRFEPTILARLAIRAARPDQPRCELCREQLAATQHLQR
jgi:ketosteroid isomerase-like protein